MQAAKDLREMASAAGVETGAVGTEGHKAPELAYGEFITDTAPDGFGEASPEIKAICGNVYDALCDDLNTPVAIAHIFDAVRIINSAKDRKAALGKEDHSTLLRLFDDIVFGVLGLKDEEAAGGKAEKIIDGLMGMVLEERKAAKAAKDWATSDRIRDALKDLGIQIKDTKDGTEWSL